MKRILLVSFCLYTLFSCTNKKDNSKTVILKSTDYTQYVIPFIGTSKMGHVFPGATTPFGMVQLSPQTNFEVMFNEDGKYSSETYEYCAGYQHRDSTII